MIGDAVMMIRFWICVLVFANCFLWIYVAVIYNWSVEMNYLDYLSSGIRNPPKFIFLNAIPLILDCMDLV